jgi:signal transduction histidine kinase
MLLLAEEKNVELFVEALRPVKVSGDEARLKQVVVNLLDNAIKYTPNGGTIRITITEAHHKAVLSITDTGIGIPGESLPHVFERFYRADKVRSREQGGAGLGLAIVRSICQAHGGTVEIESIENKGTTCRVILPLADVEE